MDYTLTQKMRIEDPSKKIIPTEASLNPISNKIKFFEILFEKIRVGAINKNKFLANIDILQSKDILPCIIKIKIIVQIKVIIIIPKLIKA